MQNSRSWPNNLKALATISVILLHVSSSPVGRYGSISNQTWWIGNIYDGSVRFCVPIFLMLTGALILPKNDNLRDFLKKRFSRIFFPFIFWSCIYIGLQLNFKWDTENISKIIDFILLKLRTGASFHLWYIYMLVGIYLTLPIISKWLNQATKKEIGYYLLIWIITSISAFPVVKNIMPEFDLRYFYGYLGYPILGYFLTYNVTTEDNKIALAGIIIGTSTTILATFLASKNSGHWNNTFYNYLSINNIISSSSIFIFFRNLSIRNNILKLVLNLISKYSYGIYLSHILILNNLSQLGINWRFINPIIGIPITTILCLATSLLLTYSISKIPFGKIISG